MPKLENIPLQTPGIKGRYVPIQILSLLESKLYIFSKMSDLLYTVFYLLSSNSLCLFFHYIRRNHFENIIINVDNTASVWIIYICIYPMSVNFLLHGVECTKNSVKSCSQEHMYCTFCSSLWTFWAPYKLKIRSVCINIFPINTTSVFNNIQSINLTRFVKF